jgi:hypothetical protein
MGCGVGRAAFGVDSRQAGPPQGCLPEGELQDRGGGYRSGRNARDDVGTGLGGTLRDDDRATSMRREVDPDGIGSRVAIRRYVSVADRSQPV